MAAIPNRIAATTAAVLALSLYGGAFYAEIIRGGILSVDAGQLEAAKALGLPAWRRSVGIVLPQALRATLPALGNWTISMFKDTPFLFALSVVELVTSAQQFGAAKFAYTEAFTLAGLIFLAASYPTSVLMRKLEVRLGH